MEIFLSWNIWYSEYRYDQLFPPCLDVYYGEPRFAFAVRIYKLAVRCLDFILQTFVDSNNVCVVLWLNEWKHM